MPQNKDDTKKEPVQSDTDSSDSSDDLDSATDSSDTSLSEDVDVDSDGAQVVVFKTKKYLPRDKATCTAWMIQSINKKVKCNFSLSTCGFTVCRVTKNIYV